MTIRFGLSLMLCVAACSSNNLSDNGDGSANGDLSMSSGADMAMSMGGDLAGGAMCDPVAQNCTDPANPKCGLVVTGMGMNRMITGECQPDGTAARDTMCTIDMTTGFDDCVKGTRCTATGLAMGAMPVCRKFCGKDGDCGAGQSCRSAVGGGGGGGGTSSIGVCIPSCTPFGTDCGAGATCATTQTDISSTMTKRVLFLSCRATGSTPLWGACQASTDCGDNATCSRTLQECVPLCDDSHACPDMPNQTDGGTGTTPTTCMPNGLPNNGGTCG